MPRLARHTVLVLIAAGAAALGAWWVAGRFADARSSSGSAAPRLELRFRVRSDQAPARSFQRALDGLVVALRAEGLRVGRIEPAAEAALLDVPGLDATRLARALTALPLVADPITGSEVRVRLREGAVRHAAEAAMGEALRQVRARVEASCPRCAPSVLRDDTVPGEIVVRLPWLDDATERTLRASVLAEPQPVPLEFLGACTPR